MVAFKSLFIAAAVVAGGAQASESAYPNKPIHFVIPGAAGSAPDLRARARTERDVHRRQMERVDAEVHRPGR